MMLSANIGFPSYTMNQIQLLVDSWVKETLEKSKEEEDKKTRFTN